MLLFIFGKRTARTASFTDTDHICYPCKAYDREIRVYRSYFHICYIPVFPVGGNHVEIRCKNCGDETRTESLVRKYEKAVKTPFWMYSAILLVLVVTAGWFYWYKNTKKNNKEYIGNPLTGDVYTIREEHNTGDTYYFLRIAGIQGDSVTALHNNLDYGGFVSNLADDDYFVKSDTLSFGKEQIKAMLENGEIYSVRRNAGDTGDFKRTR